MFIPKELCIIFLLLSFPLLLPTSAEGVPVDPTNSVSIYAHGQAQIYSYGLIQETRTFILEKGNNNIRIHQIPKHIIASSVYVKPLNSPDTFRLVEQKFNYDLKTEDELLSHFLGKSVQINQYGGEQIEGILLNVDPANLILETKTQEQSRQIHILPRGPERIINLSSIPPDFSAEPTLNWKIISEEAGEQSVILSYQTSEMAWRADYMAFLNPSETEIRLSAWVTIVNRSGKTFENTRIYLLAGDTGGFLTGDTLDPYYPQNNYDYGLGTENILEKKHIYNIPDSTLENNTTKQIELFSARDNIPVTSRYVYEAIPFQLNYGYPNTDSYHTPPGTQVNVEIEFANQEQKGLGIPLPGGIIKLYKEEKNIPCLLSEGSITHKSKNDQINLKTESSKDITGSWKQVTFKADNVAKWMEENIEITLKNTQTTQKQVKVVEHLYRWNSWKITKKSHDYLNKTPQTVHFDVSVPPGEEIVVSYTVKYTW